MLEVINTALFVTIGTVLGIVILAYALYIVLFPLVKTIGGGLQVLKAYGERKVSAKEPNLVAHPELGLTLADGGEQVRKEEKEEEKE
ncbi:MAG: hypothetical protein DRG36_01470 [Deltaproteobacteria bacterium]|nr:MAG: hypothetical protein DRG36_01470 [Deltaproteobacteria bacterium]